VKNPENPDRAGGSTPAANPRGSVRFGPFTLDLHARKLWRDDALVALPSRTFEALAYLVAHRDRAVDRDEIIAAAWHDVAVTDDSLIHAISVIRRSLGDDPAQPSFIETIPRRGYRFVAEVEPVQQLLQPEAIELTETRPAMAPAPHFLRWPWRPAVAVAFLVVAAVAAVVVSRVVNTQNETTANPVPIQQAAPPGTAIVSGGVVSPEGRYFAFIARDTQTGRTALWVRALDAVEPTRLPRTDGASQPFFSPDGRTVAFFVNGRLMATDVYGEHLRTIAPVQGAPAGGTWGINDVIVFAEWVTGLYAVPAGGGTVSRLTRLDHTALDVGHAWPQFLPDGRRFLYQVISPDSTRAGVYVANVDAPGSIRILDSASAATYVFPGLLVYLQQDMVMAEPFDAANLRFGGRAVRLARGVPSPSLAEGNGLSASRDMLTFRAGATEQLTWVDRSGRPQSTLQVPTSMFNFRLSPDGRSVLAASSLTDSTGVWLVDLAQQRSTQLAADGIAAVWSPDGTRVAFTSRAGLDLHVRSSGGGGHAERVASNQSVKVLNDWSSSANAIIYTQHEQATKLDLWHVPLSGGAAQPLLNTSFNEAQARISPDGRWIAYVSDTSGTQEVYLRRYPDVDAPRRVSTGGGAQPQWRGDQRELFFLAPDRSLMAVSLTDADASPLGVPRRLFQTSIADDPSGARDSYAAMPDGRSFLIDARRDDTTTSITVLLDWAAGLAAPPATPSDNRDASELGRRTRAP
jgi:DNA-binding winged helix-turn-helix (wHTH) protein/Tol biopolymer transport system component